MNIHNLTGLKFGYLTVMYRSESSRQGRVRWLCACICGTLKTYNSDHLTRKNNPVTSCGCKLRRKGNTNPNWKGYGDISGDWWYNHVLRERKQTKRPKIRVTITIEEAWNLYLNQNKKCALSGLPISIGWNGEASLDRIDNNLGYELNNVQWVHKDINFMKRTYSQDYFIDMCKKVAKNK